MNKNLQSTLSDSSYRDFGKYVTVRLIRTAMHELVSNKTRQLYFLIFAFTSLPFFMKAQNLTLSCSKIVNVSCYGSSSGSVTCTIGNDTKTPFKYSCNGGATYSTKSTSFTLSSLPAGTCNIKVTDAGNYIKNCSISITQPAQISCNQTIKNITCYGSNNGSITCNVGNGTNPYTYCWNGGKTSICSGSSFSCSPLSAGNYTVKVCDYHGCTFTSLVNCNQPGALTATITAKTNLSCNGSANGSATVTGSGGTTPYTYSWSDNKTTSSISSLSAGSYKVTLTDNHGCTATASVALTQPGAITATTKVISNASCNGSNNGSASVTANGGATPYTYSWSDGKKTSSISSLSAGSYTVIITDAHGCSASATVSIASSQNISVKITSTGNSCYGESNGSATVTASGGTTPYTYLWSNAMATSSVSSLSAGTYTVTVTENHGCSATATVSVSQPAQIAITPSVDNNISCYGYSNGGLQVNVTGGFIPYTYLWITGAVSSSISGLTGGVWGTTYAVVVTDNHGCDALAEVVITEPTALTATSSVMGNVTCNGSNNGNAEVTAGGGTPPYTYSWSNSKTTSSMSWLSAGNYNVTITDVHGCTATASLVITQPAVLTASITSYSDVSCNGCSNGNATVTAGGGTTSYNYLWNTGQTTSSITGLTAGTGGTIYSITVTDANGCIASASITLTEASIPSISLAFTSANVLCNGGNTGSASVTASGGTQPYMYIWSDLNSQRGTFATGLTAGNYTVTVTDALDNIKSGTVNITQPGPLILTMTGVDNFDCYGDPASGTATASTSGGTQPYTYLWSNGLTASSMVNLLPGGYSVTVTDNNSCTATNTLSIQKLPSLVISGYISSQILCNGASTGAITAAASGGIPPYAYNWSNGATTADITGLLAGYYSCYVVDATGNCDAYLALPGIYIHQPTAITISATDAGDVLCYGSNNGSANVAVNGGTSSYDFIWSNGVTSTTGSFSSAGSYNFSNLTAGTYEIEVTDGDDCDANSSVTILQPNALNVGISASGCSNGVGFLTANPDGGTMPYYYMWNNGQTNATATGLSNGTYTVVVTDSCGLTAATEATISCNSKAGTGNKNPYGGSGNQPNSCCGNIAMDMNVSIYPNPNRGIFTLTGLPKDASVILYNDLGQTIRTYKGTADASLQLDISDQSDGVYMLWILTNDGSQQKVSRIIKQ